jgi:hypothetical protein
MCVLFHSIKAHIHKSGASRIDRCLQLGSKEIRSLASVRSVAQVRSQNSSSKVSIADGVADQSTTEDLVPVTREVGDLATVSAPLSVSEADCCGDLVLDDVFDVLNTTVDNGRTLAVLQNLSQIDFRLLEA